MDFMMGDLLSASTTCADLSAKRQYPDRSSASDDDEFERQWQSEFNLRSQEAVAGLYRPTVIELVLELPPVCDCIDFDAALTAGMLLRHFSAGGPAHAQVNNLLRMLPLSPTAAECRPVASRLETEWETVGGGSNSIFAEAAARFEFYATTKGCPASALRTASRSIVAASDERLPNLPRLALVEAGLTWLLAVGGELPDGIERFGPGLGNPFGAQARLNGAEFLRLIDATLQVNGSR